MCFRGDFAIKTVVGFLRKKKLHDAGNGLKDTTAPISTLRRSGHPYPHNRIQWEYNGLRGENRGPFKGQQASASNPVMRFKMCHTFKHLLICNTFCCRLILLSLSLYIELALLCCTNPNNVNCFGTIFPNLNFVFASIWAASPVHIESDQYRSCSTVKQGPAVSATPSTPIGEQPKTALWLWVCEITCYLYTRWVHGRMKTKQRWFKVTRELSHEWFLHFRHHVHDRHWTGEFATVIWRLHCFTVSFRGDVRGESGPR